MSNYRSPASDGAGPRPRHPQTSWGTWHPLQWLGRVEPYWDRAHEPAGRPTHTDRADTAWSADHRRPRMDQPPLFKWRHFAGEIIVCGVRWYLRFALSYRDVEELMQERGVFVDHTTVFRWVQRYAPELDKRCRPQLTATNDSSRVDETYINIKKQWYYLYRAVDAAGQTIDFLLRKRRGLYGPGSTRSRTACATRTLITNWWPCSSSVPT
jgi:hypothetical protein